MTDEKIERLLRRRDRLTERRDGRINLPALNEIDAQLREVPPGQNNRIDRYLGRPCAVLPKRADYGITTAQAEQYRIMSDGFPDGIFEHDDALEGAWM